MAYAHQLGAGSLQTTGATAGTVVAPGIGTVIGSLVGSLFSSFGSGALTDRKLPQAQANVQAALQTLQSDLPNLMDPSTPAGRAFSQIRCWGGDRSQDATFNANTAPYCGFAEQSSRNYARAAVIAVASAALQAGISVPTTYTFYDVDAAGGGAKTLSASASLLGSGGGAGMSVLGVSGGSVGGIPVVALAVGGGLLLMAMMGGKH